METVVDESADVVQVQSLHFFNPLHRLLEGCQPHVEVDLIQVSAVEGVKLDGRN